MYGAMIRQGLRAMAASYDGGMFSMVGENYQPGEKMLAEDNRKAMSLVVGVEKTVVDSIQPFV